MKFVYKGTTYRTENLTDELKEVMKKEIDFQERKNKERDEQNKTPEKEVKAKKETDKA